jgi:hypothetical protein
MAKLLPYLERLVEDEYVQEQLRSGAGALLHAYQRAARKPAQAPQDKKLYGNLRRAAASIRNSAMALGHAPEPPPKHRGRNALIIGLGIGATVAMGKWAQKQRDAASSGPPTSSGAGVEVTTAPAQPESTIVASHDTATGTPS